MVFKRNFTALTKLCKKIPIICFRVIRFYKIYTFFLGFSVWCHLFVEILWFPQSYVKNPQSLCWTFWKSVGLPKFFIVFQVLEVPSRFTPNCVKKSIETVLEPPKLLFYCYYFLIDILYFSLSVFKKLLLEAWSINIGDSIRYNSLAEISNFISRISFEYCVFQIPSK